MANSTIKFIQKANHWFYFEAQKFKDTVLIYLFLDEIELLLSISHRRLWQRLSPCNEWDFLRANDLVSWESGKHRTYWNYSSLLSALSGKTHISSNSAFTLTRDCYRSLPTPKSDSWKGWRHGGHQSSSPTQPRCSFRSGSPWAEPGKGRISSTAKVFTAASKQTSNMHKV